MPDRPEEQLRALAGAYRPSVNVAQAPHPLLVLPFLAAGWISLVVAGLLSVRFAPLLAQRSFAAFPVLGLVHLVTLGFLTTTILGTLHQWIPVVFDVQALDPKLASRQALIWGGGLLIFLLGWFVGDVGMVAAGGGIAALGLLLFTVLASERLAKSTRPRDTIFWTVSGALLALNLVWALGLGMALSWNGASIGLPQPEVLAVHLATALVVWMGLLMMGVELKLVPMFAMASLQNLRVGGPPTLAVAGYTAFLLSPWWNALSALAAVFWLAAALWALGQVGWSLRYGKAPRPKDRVFVPVVLAWLLWAAAAWASLGSGWLTVLLALGGAGLFILGYQSRILPFVIALYISRRLPGPAAKAFFLARSLHTGWGPPAVSLAWLLALAGFGLGIGQHQASYVAAAGALVVATMALHLLALAYGVGTGYRRHRPSPEGTAPSS